MFEKSDDLRYAQRRAVEFYLSARDCRGTGNPDLLEAKMESAHWWLRAAVIQRQRCAPVPLASGGFRLRVA